MMSRLFKKLTRKKSEPFFTASFYDEDTNLLTYQEVRTVKGKDVFHIIKNK